MVHIREILRLRLVCRRSYREIARSCGVGHSSVEKYVLLARTNNLSFAAISAMNDSELVALFDRKTGRGSEEKPLPDFAELSIELKKPSVTKGLLWTEYRAVYPDGYGISQFNELFRQWLGKQKLSLRQEHKAGENLFVDYSGLKVSIRDPQTGETRACELFVAVLGASNYTYVEAQESQSCEHWIGGHVRAFEFFGGVPKAVVCDNLKSGVTRACRYEPLLNRTYHDMADHYGIAVLPARPHHPKDKSKVEVGVQIAERWIVARLRNMTFFSLAQINDQIRVLLAELNDKPFKQIPGSRTSLFSEIEKSTLSALPAEPYSVREWKNMKVSSDYHVEIHGHLYSVPYRLRGETVSVAYDTAIVEIFHDNKRIASHARDDRRGKMSTARDHLAPSHVAHAENNYEKLMVRAQAVGSATHSLFAMIAANRQHITQCIGSFRGILRLADKHPSEEIEAACAKALIIRGYTYRSVASILSNNLQRSPSLPRGEIRTDHENIRGWQHFALTKETAS